MSDDGTVGKTIREYIELGRHIACVEKQLADIAAHLQRVSEALAGEPLQVAISEGGVRIATPNPIAIGAGYETIEIVSRGELDPDHWDRLLKDLRQSRETEAALARALQGMGLSEAVRRRTPGTDLLHRPTRRQVKYIIPFRKSGGMPGFSGIRVRASA